MQARAVVGVPLCCWRLAWCAASSCVSAHGNGHRGASEQGGSWRSRSLAWQQHSGYPCWSLQRPRDMQYLEGSHVCGKAR